MNFMVQHTLFTYRDMSFKMQHTDYQTVSFMLDLFKVSWKNNSMCQRIKEASSVMEVLGNETEQEDNKDGEEQA